MDQEVLLTFSTPHSNPQTMKVLQCLQSMAGRGLSAGAAAYEGVGPNGMPFSIVPPPPPGYIKGEGVGGGTGESPASHRYQGNGEGTGGSPGYGMAHDRHEQQPNRSRDMHGRMHEPNGMGPDRPYESHGPYESYESYRNRPHEPYGSSPDRPREPPYGYGQPSTGEWPSMITMENKFSREDHDRYGGDSPPPPPPPRPQQQGSDDNAQHGRSERVNTSATRTPSTDYPLPPQSGSLKVPAPAPVPAQSEPPAESGGNGMIPNFFNMSPNLFGPRPNSQQVPSGPPPTQAVRGYVGQQMPAPGTAYRSPANGLSFTMPAGVGMPTPPAQVGPGHIPATTGPSFQGVGANRGYSFTGPIAPTPVYR